MRISRRFIFSLPFAIAGAFNARKGLAAILSPGRAKLSAYPLNALPPFLDTLLPADESPSATQLGIDKKFIAQARVQGALMQILRVGCRWLDAEARATGAADFAALPEIARETIVAGAAGLPRGAPQREFFERIRGQAFYFYYARSESWPSLGFDGPPQPNGFVDFDRPPV